MKKKTSDVYSGSALVSPHGPKAIVICADDFGANNDIDTAILQLAALGRLSATSCMSFGPSFLANAAALRETDLQTGVHINFTESLGQVGFYRPLKTLIIAAYARRLPATSLREQIARQLDQFEKTMGRAPDFIDGHQHVHQLPQIREALLSELGQRYVTNKPWLRYTRPRKAAHIPLALQLKAHIIRGLGAEKFAHLAKTAGFRVNRRFVGVYNFQGGKTAYQRLLTTWLQAMQTGDVLMCHPAAALNRSDALATQRLAEFHVLANEATAKCLSHLNLQLNFRSTQESQQWPSK